MSLPRKDLVATGLVGVAVALYLLWAIDLSPSVRINTEADPVARPTSQSGGPLLGVAGDGVPMDRK